MLFYGPFVRRVSRSCAPQFSGVTEGALVDVFRGPPQVSVGVNEHYAGTITESMRDRLGEQLGCVRGFGLCVTVAEVRISAGSLRGLIDKGLAEEMYGLCSMVIGKMLRSRSIDMRASARLPCRTLGLSGRRGIAGNA